MEESEIKFIFTFVVLAIIFTSMVIISIVKQKKEKIKFFKFEYIPVYFDAGILAAFIIFKSLSLYALMLYFLLEAFVNTLITFTLHQTHPEELYDFFRDNEWVGFLFDLRIFAVIFLALFMVDVNTGNIIDALPQLKWPAAYLLVFTAGNLIFSKSKQKFVMDSMAETASNIIPIMIIAALLFFFKQILNYSTHAALFFIFLQMILRIVISQTILKSYPSEDADKNILVN